jgi:hypothetical protein
MDITMNKTDSIHARRFLLAKLKDKDISKTPASNKKVRDV